MSSQVKVVKVYTETSKTQSSEGSGSSNLNDKTERREYHSMDELPPDTKKYIDELLGGDIKNKFDNISFVSEQQTRYSQPEVKVVNISHKKVIEENRQIPVVDERTMTSQYTNTSSTTTSSNQGVQSQDKGKHTFNEETKTFSKEMLDQLPDDCKKYVSDFMTQQGMQNKNIEHVTVHTTRENTTSSNYGGGQPNDIPDLQVKNCLQSNDKIVVEIDASGFGPQDISMKANGRNLTIQGRKEGPDPNDPQTTLRKELKRDIVMPPGVDAAHISCSLCVATGKLTITIPFPQPIGMEYSIPIRTE